MKKVSKWINYRHSFLFHFLIRFIFMIIIPILISWWIYVEVLNYYYNKNTLTTQQVNMENSLSWLESTLNATSNVFTALGSNTEIMYYLEYYDDKSSMLYSLLKNVRSFCSNLYMMTPYLTSLKIYSDNPTLLYASPFTRLNEISLDTDVLSLLENTHPKEIIWKVSVPEGENLPVIYGYQKLYIANYVKCIGYVEVQLSSELFSDYFELLFNLGGDPYAEFCLYHDDTLIYACPLENARPPFALDWEHLESGSRIDFFKNQYINVIKIPQLDLYLIRFGKITDLLTDSSGNLLTILISLIIFLLLLLFVWFFLHIVSFSKRILVFSSFIQDSDTDNLSPFPSDSIRKKDADELDTLINAYNTMIHENSALISQVHKMELLSQDAKYQALQEQIHPHFIYGTLETIRMMALQNKDREVASMIFSLSSLIRYSISISSKCVTLRDEIEIASHYLKIQKVRFDERMDYTFRVNEEFLGLELPSFLLQPILENAIVYGVSNTLDYCMISVNVCQEGSNIILSVSNTGLPIAQERLEEINNLLSGVIPIEAFQGKHNGLALYNIRERLTIFFHGCASIRLTSKGNYTNTIITIRKEV